MASSSKVRASKQGGLQYTFYFPTTKDKERWRRLSKPYTLNKWVFMMVEKALAGKTSPKPTTTTEANHEDTINQLRKQNELLTARLQQALSELNDLRKGSEPTLDKNVVEVLKSGGVWTSQNLLKKLMLSTFINNVSNDLDANVNTPLDMKSIGRTLDTLQDLNLVENTWQGFKWIK